MIIYNTHKLLFLDKWNRDFYELAEISPRFKYIILIFVILNMIVSIMCEYFSNVTFAKWWNNK